MHSSGIEWQGHAHIDLGWAAFVGTTGDNRAHAHHALQVIVAFASPVRLWTPSGELEIATAAVVPSDLLHALRPCDAPVGLLYIDAESSPARQFQRDHDDIWVPPQADIARLRAAFAAAVVGDPSGHDDLMRQMQWPQSPRIDDPRVASVVARLTDHADLDVSVGVIAAWAHLSTSRFAHRFREHTGMPVRPYLRWLRLRRAAGALAAGQSVTDAAHFAGFADAAHLARTFQRHFGINPRVLGALARR